MTITIPQPALSDRVEDAKLEVASKMATFNEVCAIRHTNNLTEMHAANRELNAAQKELAEAEAELKVKLAEDHKLAGNS